MTNDSNLDVQATDAFRRQKNKEEMQKQVISFALMIFFTLISFGMVATGTLSRMYALPILFVMAIVQAGFQFFYFMHLKDKDHEMPTTLILGGVWCAFLTLAGLMVISWW